MPEPEKGSEPDVKKFALESTVKLILDASMRLNCSVRARCKALYIYHHFKSCVGEMNFDPYLLAAACCSLSVKSIGENINIDSILMTFINICRESGECLVLPAIEAMKPSVTQMECITLRTIDFSMFHHLAHEYLAYFLFGKEEIFSTIHIWTSIVQHCIKITSDFYLSNKCLVYNPEDIALSAVQVALYLVGIQIEKDPYLTSWIQSIKEIPKEKSQEIMEDIFKICEVGPVAERQNSN